MGQVGFGSYRISVRSKEHREALTHALSLGCPLIDTSANYTDGDSEKLIGEVLKMNPEFSPIIVTKAGYIQGKNLEVASQFQEDLVDLGESLKHSIHPDFLKDQLDKSLARLQKASIDTFLLHNPEYYFQTAGATQDEYYRRIEKAFAYLEEEVKKGRIKSYGISSNNFVLPLADPAVTNLSRVLEAAKKVEKETGEKHHFTTIQFPFNLIEIGALEKFGDYGDESLLELAKLNNLVTMSNRPLNAFTNEQLVRLATYDDLTKDFDEAAAEKHYEMCMKLVEEKWAEATKDDELVDMDDFHELTLIKQFKDLWKTLPSPDAVEQVYLGHFFPFIARIWGESGLDAKEAKPFYELLDHSLMFARKNMTNKALAFKKQAEGVGLIPIETDQPFAVDVIETYLNYGIDYVLLGMRKTNYVDQVKHLFKA